MSAYRPPVLCTCLPRIPRRLAPLLPCAALLLVLGACATASGAAGGSSPTATSTPVIPAIIGTSALMKYTGHSDAVIAVAWSPDGKAIASCGNDGTVQGWIARTGQRLWRTTVGRYAFAVAWSPDGKRIIAGAGSDGMLALLEASSGRELASFSAQAGFVEGLAWSPDGKQFASSSQDDNVAVWNLSNLSAPVLTYTGHTDAVAHVAWSPDGTRIASASYDGTVKVWDAKTGETLLTYKGQGAPVWSVAWSPDSTRIASGSGAAGSNGPVTVNNSVRVWDATTGRTIYTFPDASGQSYALAWSPDGTRIAASDGKIVRVWDAAIGKPIVQYTGHSDDVFAVVWSPDSSLIASASVDDTVQVWRPQA